MKRIMSLFLVVVMLVPGAFAVKATEDGAIVAAESQEIALQYKASGSLMIQEQTQNEGSLETQLTQLDFDLVVKGDSDTESIVLTLDVDGQPAGGLEALIEFRDGPIEAFITLSRDGLEEKYRMTIDSSGVLCVYAVNMDKEILLCEYSLQAVSMIMNPDMIFYQLMGSGAQAAWIPLINKLSAFEGRVGDHMTIHVRELLIPLAQMVNDPGVKQALDSIMEENELLQSRIGRAYYEEFLSALSNIDVTLIGDACAAFEISMLENDKCSIQYFSEGSADNSEYKLSMEVDEYGLNFKAYEQSYDETGNNGTGYDHIGSGEYSWEDGIHFVAEDYTNGTFIYFDAFDADAYRSGDLLLEARLVYNFWGYGDPTIAVFKARFDIDDESGNGKIGAWYQIKQNDGSEKAFTFEMDQAFAE